MRGTRTVRVRRMPGIWCKRSVMNACMSSVLLKRGGSFGNLQLARNLAAREAGILVETVNDGFIQPR